MVLVRLFSIAVLYLLLVSLPLLSQEGEAKSEQVTLNSAVVDSLLEKYYLDGVKVFIEKLGVLSIKQKNLSLERKEFDNRLMINVQRSLSLNRNELHLIMQYQINPRLFLKGESNRSIKGIKSSVNLVYKFEY